MPLQLTGSGAYIRPQPVPKMPPGLVELMEGMTREVLKYNPADVYEFCAKHMEQLIIIRDGKAPKRYKMTLEQKIKKVQERLRESADLRRRLYDEAIKKVNMEATPSSSLGHKSETIVCETDETDIILRQQNESIVKQKTQTEITEETKHDFKNEGTNLEPDNKETGELQISVSQKVNNLAEDVAEGKLKAPVHHEKELAEALEVEIFHKPLGNLETKNQTITENKDEFIPKDDIQEISKENQNGLKEDTLNDMTVKTEHHKDEILANGIKYISDNAGTENETEKHLEEDIQNDLTARIILLEQDASDIKSKNSNLEQELDDNQSQEFNNQVKVSEVISEEPNDQPEQDIGNVSKILERQTELIKENSDKMIDEIIPNPSTELIKENSDKMIDEIIPNQSSETKASNGSLTVMNDEEHKDISSKSARTLDKAASFAIEIEESLPSSENYVDAKSGDSLVVIEQDPVLNIKEELIVDKIEETPVEDIESGDDKKQNYEHVCDNITNKSENPPKSNDCLQRVETEDNTKQVTISADSASNLIVDNTEDSDKEQTLNESAIQESKEIIEQKAGYNNQMLEINVTKKENELIPTKCMDVGPEPIPPLSVESNKEESFSKNDEKAISGPSKNLEKKLSIESSIVHEAGKESKTEIKFQDIDSAPKPAFDEGIATEHKVLVEETTNIKDDIDVAPTAIFKDVNEGTQQMNSLHSSENVIQNGSETSEPNIPSKKLLQDTSVEPASDNKGYQALDIQETASTTSEPAKTETSSIEEPSSLEEIIFEEGTGSIIEVKTIDPSVESTEDNRHTMDLETAAITIQKVFRSFLFKRSTFDDMGHEGANSIDEDNEKVEFPVTATSVNKERRTLGISRMDTVLQTVNEEKSLSLSTDDSSLSSAATIIQAHVRGFLVRNRLSSTKTSSASLGKSDGPSISFEADNEQKTNKTVLNIHIVPEGEHFLSRDESVLTSMDFSLDGSPASSTNLHPLGYDKNEPRKQLKREDAIQSSVTPPSNNSGKLSEDVESVKGISDEQKTNDSLSHEPGQDAYTDSRDDSPTKSTTIETVIEAHGIEPKIDKKSLEKASLDNSDESDVVCEDKGSTDSDNTLGLLHSGEFHDIVLPTKVYRSETTVVRGE